MGCNRVVASEGYGPWLQRALHREEFIAYLLAVQVLDDIVCQANFLELTEGVALHNHTTQQSTFHLIESNPSAIHQILILGLATTPSKDNLELTSADDCRRMYHDA